MSKGSGAISKSSATKAAHSAPLTGAALEKRVEELRAEFRRNDDAYYGADFHNNRTAVGYITKALGGDAPPTNVDSELFNEMEKHDKFLYVGFRTTGSDAQNAQFKWGANSYDGMGIYGNGHYLAVGKPNSISSQRDALRDSLSYGQGKHAMRIGIPKTAKIGDYAELKKESQAIKDKWIPEDVLALRHGYDGYVVRSSSRPDYFVLLNRKVVVIDNSYHNK